MSLAVSSVHATVPEVCVVAPNKKKVGTRRLRFPRHFEQLDPPSTRGSVRDINGGLAPRRLAEGPVE